MEHAHTLCLQVYRLKRDFGGVDLITLHNQIRHPAELLYFLLGKKPPAAAVSELGILKNPLATPAKKRGFTYSHHAAYLSGPVISTSIYYRWHFYSLLLLISICSIFNYTQLYSRLSERIMADDIGTHSVSTLIPLALDYYAVDNNLPVKSFTNQAR
jgi:hypothetical protein